MPNQTDYEAMTVPELKDLADQRGIEVMYDARKAEIIAALEASDTLLKPTQPSEEKESKEGESEGEVEDKNIYEYQMSSTVEALCSQDDFWKLKLHS